MGFSRALNRLARLVQQLLVEKRENVLRMGQRGISIPERLAGLDRQGFQGVSATFEAIIISRQGLDVGGLLKSKNTHRLNTIIYGVQE